MHAVRRSGTAPESALLHELRASGFAFDTDVTVAGLARRRMDLVFAERRVAVCVDGCFWHGCPEHATWPRANAAFWLAKIEANRRRDADTTKRLESLGWHVFRVWEHEPPAEAAARILNHLTRLGQPAAEEATAPGGVDGDPGG